MMRLADWQITREWRHRLAALNSHLPWSGGAEARQRLRGAIEKGGEGSSS